MGHIRIGLLYIAWTIDCIPINNAALQHQNNFLAAMGVFGHSSTGRDRQQAGGCLAIDRWQNALPDFAANGPPFDRIDIPADIVR